MTRARLCLLVAAVLLLAGCAGDPAPPPAHRADVRKVLVMVVENHSLDQMRGGMPALFAASRRYGYATGFHATTHPSLPNYLAMTGGSTFGVTDDGPPEQNGVHGRSVFGQALAAGARAGLYADAMPRDCDTGTEGRYAVKHNPWAYFLDEHAACARSDVPLDRLPEDVAAGRLPAVGMVIPDLCNDAHDCDLGTADAWIRDRLRLVMSGPDWRSGHLLVVVTADEDDRNQDNLVLTSVLHPSLHHAVSQAPLTHYSIARLYAEVLGVRPLREAASAPSLLTAFGLRLPVRRG
ncbi:MAG: phosphoesterase [Nocardioidaceae bacterium]|nr:phosphoesterase [Nocardioidaceae bacterium]NUS50380.1 phosphoesterase [Nocardioidaceae bacterium]